MEDFDKARRQRRFRQKNIHNRRGRDQQPRPREARRKIPRERISYDDYIDLEDDDDFYEEFGEFFMD